MPVSATITDIAFATPQVGTNAGLLSTLNGGSNQAINTNPLKTEFPDAAVGLTWQQPWGHLKLTTLMHEAALVDGLHVNRQYLGYGGGVSGDDCLGGHRSGISQVVITAGAV